MICQQTNLRPGKMYYTFGDCHIYNNHISQCELQLTREPYNPPSLVLNQKNDIDSYDFSDFVISGYNHYDIIKGDVSI
jgi:thymidylate synthase